MSRKASFFVAYPKKGEAEANRIVTEISERLLIDYDLWSYAAVEDAASYYQEVMEPAIENADFVLAFIAKNSEDDYLLTEAIRLCSNLNKSIVPIKLGKGWIREKHWGFRTKMMDLSDESQKVDLIEQMHGWLGLTTMGDIYGSIVYIKSDTPCVIMRNDEVLGNDEGNGLNCIFAQGCSNIIVKAEDGSWNRYRYQVLDNNSKLQFDVSLTGVCQLAKYDVSNFMFNPDSDSIPRWDLTNRRDFVLISSSEDDTKRKIIFDSYYNYYCSKLKPYPEFHPEIIEHSKNVRIFFWVISILLLFLYGAGLLTIGGYYLVRQIRDRIVERRNERNRQELITTTDNWNRTAWIDANDRMNKELDLYGLPHSNLPNLGTPSDFLDAFSYDYKQIG